MTRTPLCPEDEEWVTELTTSWVEVYKKAATTLALLRIVRDHGPVSAQEIAPLFTQATTWPLSERGLYRSLRRLAQTGSLDVSKTQVPRTGAQRQEFALTPAGREYLRRIQEQHLA